MGLNNTAKNALLTTLSTLIGYVSLHATDPGTAGVNEIAGGPPPYARQPVLWLAPSGGVLTADTTGGPPLFDVPAATTITHFGLWSTATAGTFYGSDPLSTPEFYEGPGTYTLATLDLRLT